MTQYSSADIEYTARLLSSARDNNEPFAILTGAGCSMTAGIPGARALMKQIEAEYPHLLMGLTTDERGNYGRCMGQLSSAEQRRLLRPHLDKAKINWAHIAIAGLMRSDYIARILTFNFDNVLARACGLAGLYPPTYDFAVAPSETFQHFGHRAVLHLHGQGHGFEMFNSEERTKLHAQRLHPLLTDTFHNFPLLVVGYSGQSDAVFAEMEKIFSGRQRLIWTSYSEDVPDHLEGFLKSGGHTAQFFGGADADKFLVELARELKCFPSLFEDPYGHLLYELDEIAPHPFPVDGRGDMLNGLRTELADAQSAKRARGLSVEDLYRQGRWSDVLENFDPSVDGDRDFAYWAAINKADAEFEKAIINKDLKLAEVAEKSYIVAVEIQPGRSEAIFNWGIDKLNLARALSDKNLVQEAIDLFERALLLEESADIIRSLGHAQIEMAKILQDNEYLKVAISTLRRSIEKDSTSSSTYNSLANAISDLAKMEGDEDGLLESFKVYEKSVEIDPQNHMAIANWANALGDLALIRGDKELLAQSSEKYNEAISNNSEDHLVYHNWGSDLGNFGFKTSDQELVELSCEKYNKAIEINSVHTPSIRALGRSLLYLALSRNDGQLAFEALSKFKDCLTIDRRDDRALTNWAEGIAALSKLQSSKEFVRSALESYRAFEDRSGFGSVDIAEALLSLDDKDAARRELEACRDAGVLPVEDALRKRPSMATIVDEPWFKALFRP